MMTPADFEYWTNELRDEIASKISQLRGENFTVTSDVSKTIEKLIDGEIKQMREKFNNDINSQQQNLYDLNFLESLTEDWQASLRENWMNDNDESSLFNRCFKASLDDSLQKLLELSKLIETSNHMVSNRLSPKSISSFRETIQNWFNRKSTNPEKDKKRFLNILKNYNLGNANFLHDAQIFNVGKSALFTISTIIESTEANLKKEQEEKNPFFQLESEENKPYNPDVHSAHDEPDNPLDEMMSKGLFDDFSPSTKSEQKPTKSIMDELQPDELQPNKQTTFLSNKLKQIFRHLKNKKQNPQKDMFFKSTHTKRDSNTKINKKKLKKNKKNRFFGK